MASALPTSLRDPRQVIDGIAELMRRFAEDFGIEIHFALMPDHETARLDGDAATLTIRYGAPLDDQVKALSDFWHFIAVGPHAAPHIHRRPTLRIVPATHDPRFAQFN